MDIGLELYVYPEGYSSTGILWESAARDDCPKLLLFLLLIFPTMSSRREDDLPRPRFTWTYSKFRSLTFTYFYNISYTFCFYYYHNGFNIILYCARGWVAIAFSSWVVSSWWGLRVGMQLMRRWKMVSHCIMWSEKFWGGGGYNF